MEITVVRSGGQTGRPFQLGPVDTAKLDDEPRRKIEEQVEESGFFDLPARIDDAEAFDSYKYEITVADEGRTHSVGYDELSEEAERCGLKDLVKLLEQVADWEPGALGTQDDDQAEDDDRKLECGDWSAHLDGEDLHVKGHCRAPVAGVRARLELGNEGIDDEPDLLVLELKVEWPEVANEVVSPVDINQVFREQPDIKRVRIQGGAEAEFEVD